MGSSPSWRARRTAVAQRRSHGRGSSAVGRLGATHRARIRSLSTANRRQFSASHKVEDEGAHYGTEGGFVWRIEGQMTGDAAATLATSLIEQISEPP